MKKAVKARKPAKKPKDAIEHRVWCLLTTWEDGQRILMPHIYHDKKNAAEIIAVAKATRRCKSIKWVRCKLTLEKPL
jgi:hypothetical protein